MRTQQVKVRRPRLRKARSRHAPRLAAPRNASDDGRRAQPAQRHRGDAGISVFFARPHRSFSRFWTLHGKKRVFPSPQQAKTRFRKTVFMSKRVPRKLKNAASQPFRSRRPTRILSNFFSFPRKENFKDSLIISRLFKNKNRKIFHENPLQKRFSSFILSPVEGPKQDASPSTCPRHNNNQ